MIINKVSILRPVIEEYNPEDGIFSGPDYKNYINSFDDKIRDTVVQYLNFTKNFFLEANQIKNEILKNEGIPE